MVSSALADLAGLSTLMAEKPRIVDSPFAKRLSAPKAVVPRLDDVVRVQHHPELVRYLARVCSSTLVLRLCRACR